MIWVKVFQKSLSQSVKAVQSNAFTRCFVDSFPIINEKSIAVSQHRGTRQETLAFPAPCRCAGRTLIQP